MGCPYVQEEKGKYAMLLPERMRRYCTAAKKYCPDVPFNECAYHNDIGVKLQ